MYGRDRHQVPQVPSLSRGAQARFYRYEPLLDPSRVSSSSTSCSSSSTSPNAPSATPAPSNSKKRKWYKPRLGIKLHEDWIWVGFISAGNTAPTGRGVTRAHGVKDDGDDWEQLPAYEPPKVDRSGQTDRVAGRTPGGHDEWFVEPPSIEPADLRRDEAGLDPPAYRPRDD